MPHWWASLCENGLSDMKTPCAIQNAPCNRPLMDLKVGACKRLLDPTTGTFQEYIYANRSLLADQLQSCHFSSSYPPSQSTCCSLYFCPPSLPSPSPSVAHATAPGISTRFAAATTTTTETRAKRVVREQYVTLKHQQHNFSVEYFHCIVLGCGLLGGASSFTKTCFLMDSLAKKIARLFHSDRGLQRDLPLHRHPRVLHLPGHLRARLRKRRQQLQQ
jgi:hypothetical protein